MAYEMIEDTITVPASTGLTRYRFVTLSTAAATQGWAVKPTLGGPILGTVFSVTTTGSTRDPQYIPIQTCGIAKVEAVGGTLAAGDLVQATSIGRAKATTGGSYVVGRVISGSSGSTGRILSIQLTPIGTT